MAQAHIRWCGQLVNAEPVRQLANGNWIMRAPGAREIEVPSSDIIEMPFGAYETALKPYGALQRGK